MASGATGVAWADKDSASDSSSSDNKSVSRPDAAPSDTSPSRGKKKTIKKDGPEVNGDATDAEDAPSRNHRRAEAPKANTPARSTTEDAGEDPTVERADTPAAVEKPAESTAPTRTVTVNAVNDAPAAVGDTVAVDEDGLLIVNPADLLANDTDIDGDDLTLEGYTQPEHGALWINRDGTISYNPDADFYGTDTFSYTVTDGTESVTATVNAVDDAPVATDDTLEATEDTPLTFSPETPSGNDTDAEGNTLAVVIGAAPTNGTPVQNADGTYTYTPNADFNGTDSFTYSVSDGTTTRALATVTINVAAVDDGPVAANDSLEATEDTALTFFPGSLLDNDVNTTGGTLSVDSFTQPAHGTLVLNADGTFTYTPNANFFTATATQTYVFGQTEAPVDTVMIVYRGTFDHSSPEVNAVALNDDSSAHTVPVTGCGGNTRYCPRVTLDLVAGEQVSIVVTTYSAGRPLGLPQTFYTSGPGRFSTTPPEDTFLITATDSSGATTTFSVQAPITPLPVSVAL